ncbi:hypothetical protein D3C75_1166650 [compost metagenome]
MSSLKLPSGVMQMSPTRAGGLSSFELITDVSSSYVDSVRSKINLICMALGKSQIGLTSALKILDLTI